MTTSSEDGTVAAGSTLVRSAQRQLAAMADADVLAVRRCLATLDGPGDVTTRGTPLGACPSGQLYRLRAGRVRVLVAVDGPFLTVLGFGLRPIRG